MARLIDADEAIDVIFEKCDEYDFDDDYCSGVMDGLGKAIKIIDEQPTIEPVKRGKWVKSDDYYTGAYETLCYYKCSECQNESLEDEFGVGNYCRWCGAEMDG